MNYALYAAELSKSITRVQVKKKRTEKDSKSVVVS